MARNVLRALTSSSLVVESLVFRWRGNWPGRGHRCASSNRVSLGKKRVGPVQECCRQAIPNGPQHQTQDSGLRVTSSGRIGPKYYSRKRASITATPELADWKCVQTARNLLRKSLLGEPKAYRSKSRNPGNFETVFRLSIRTSLPAIFCPISGRFETRVI